MAYAILTRDHETAAPYAEALVALGLEAVAMPVTFTQEPADPDALVRALQRGGYTAIVCASARAATAVVLAKGHAPLPEVWAVGPATARVLEAARVPVIVPPVDQARDGATLARALVAARPLAGKRVLVPRAEDGRDELLEILREAGADVDGVIAYRTLAVAADEPDIQRGLELLLGGDEAAVCVVFAPSQVTALARVVAARGATLAGLRARFVAIGETTGAALRAGAVEPRAIAEQPTPAGIAKAVASVYPPRS